MKRVLAATLTLLCASGCGGASSDEPADGLADAIADGAASPSPDAAEPVVTADATPSPDGAPPDASEDASADASEDASEIGDGAADGGGPTDPLAKSVLVYSLNIENMIFDWKDVVHVMERDDRKVDLFLVQQATNEARLDDLTDFMSARLGEKYAGVLAQNAPTHTRFQGEVTPKPPVTTGVIWRVKRFEYVAHTSWFPYGDKVDGSHTCASRTNHSGYETIRVRLQDTLAKKSVVAASLRHWTWMDCSLKNMIEMIDGEPKGPSAHSPMPDVPLQIVGGDFNGPAFDGAGDYKCWYRAVVAGLGGEACSGHANLGFADPVYDKCKGDKGCVDAQSGIDFIFGRVAGGKPARTAGFRVISYDEGDAADKAETGSDGRSNRAAVQGFDDVTSNYSEHRARRAVFFYE